MNFTIIGFGEVGSLVGALINSRFNNSTLNIFDFPEEISGRILDFKHACACNNNTVLVNSIQKVEEANYIIYAAGYCNQVGESRYSVAQRNKDLIHEIFSGIKVNPSTTVIAVTNPVEPVSLWIHQILKGNNLVLGTGTSLDTARLVSILSTHFNCQASEIETLVIGEHGDWMIPLFSQTKINGKSILDLVSDQELKKIEVELKNSARNIRKTEKATKYGVAEVCLQLIIKTLNQQSSKEIVSVHIPDNLKNEFGIKNDLFVSLPVTLASGGFTYDHFTMNTKEKSEFQAALHSISSAP
jgi:malate/lactate dehydrogenase